MEVSSMNWTSARTGAGSKRKTRARHAGIEALESRALLADGITPSPWSPISAVAGTPISSAVFATYSVSDPSGLPGTKWRAKISFGDGQVDKNVIPTQVGSGFEFVDSHTYRTPGTFTVTVMIAVPGSHLPNDNTVTTQVTVTPQAPTPTPTPTGTPPSAIGNFQASGLNVRAKANTPFRGNVARFSDPKTRAQQFHAMIDWGDGSAPTGGQIRTQAKGRFLVVGAHRYLQAGSFQATVTIVSAPGLEIAAVDSVQVISRPRRR
jgi:hypothetical protein